MLKFSQSDRNLFKLNNFNPPVGKYDVRQDMLSHDATNSFCKKSRFQDRQGNDSQPGPGHYFKPIKPSALQQSKGQLYKQCNREGQISMVPSIPCRDSYIYQDMGNGIIISIKMPPIKQQTRQLPKGNICRLALKSLIPSFPYRNDTNAQLVEVCGQSCLLKEQDIMKLQSLNNQSTKMDSEIQGDISNLKDNNISIAKLTEEIVDAEDIFEMLEQKNKLMNGKILPGPGNYNLPSMFNKKNGKVGQAWSKSSRFCQPYESIEKKPGPGAYNVEALTKNSGIKVSLADRFDQNNFNSNPGPGSYKLPTLIQATRKHRNTLQFQSVFGGGSRRFTSPKCSSVIIDLTQPGPGSYNTNLKKKKKCKNILVRLQLQPQALSESERDLLVQQQQLLKYTHGLPSPPPNNTCSFKSSPRFKDVIDEKDGYLGPGYYDIKQQSKNFNRKGSHFGRSPRE